MLSKIKIHLNLIAVEMWQGYILNKKNKIFLAVTPNIFLYKKAVFMRNMI